MRRWKFETRNFTVELVIERERRYKYDGDDENGETQAKLDSGEYIAFSSVVRVLYDGEEIGWDSLGGSVYAANAVSEFWTEHRAPDSMNRNCMAMRQARGGSSDAKYSICHYFPGMVVQACQMARQTIAQRRAALENLPHIRA